MKKVIVTMAVAMATVWSANAALIELSLDTDVDIRSKDLADTGYNRTTLAIGNAGADPSTTRSFKAYVRFKMPDDFGTATSATFTVTRAAVGAFNAPYDVHGLDDGIANEINWPDNNNSAGTTWNNAPGNNTTSPDGFINSTLVGQFETLKADFGGVAGDSWSISGTDLVNFLNLDSNGYVTLMIARTLQSSSSDVWASNENSTYAGPSLEMDYVAIPEPGTLAMIVISGLGLMVFRRRIMI
jgi:hypothetical protein